MIQEIAILVTLLAVVVVLLITGIATLVIVAKIYRMHNVRNADGEYAWMVPGKWMEFQKTIVESQERMVGTLNASSDNQVKMSKLLESLTNATLALSATVNGGGDGKRE